MKPSKIHSLSITMLMITILCAGICRSSDQIYYEVVPSKTVLFVGDYITVTVTQVDEDPDCDYYPMEMLISQDSGSGTAFLPASHFVQSGLTDPISFQFQAAEPGLINFTVSTYGEDYCGYWIWAYNGGVSETVEVLSAGFSPTPTATPTALPPHDTWTPAPTYTATPTASPTSNCPPTGLECDVTVPQGPGDHFTYTVEACNGTEEGLAVDIYIVLEVYGQYYFWPSWTRTLDSSSSWIPACSCVNYIILDFPWPDELGSSLELNFWNLMTRAGTYEPLGSIDLCTVIVGD